MFYAAQYLETFWLNEYMQIFFIYSKRPIIFMSGRHRAGTLISSPVFPAEMLLLNYTLTLHHLTRLGVLKKRSSEMHGYIYHEAVMKGAIY